MRLFRVVLAALCLGLACLPAEVPAQTAPAKPARGDGRELIAVMDLQAVGATPAEAQALSDRMREVLLKTGHFKLVERSQMDQVLNEQALQQTGCTSQECAVQVGRILGVRKLVVGKVVKVSEEVWLLSALLVDVESAETLRAESVRHKGDFFSLMDDQVREIGEKMAEPNAPAEVAAVTTAPASPEPSAPPPVTRGRGSADPYRLALFPGLFGGQAIDTMKNGRSNRDWIVYGIQRALMSDPRLLVTFSYYDGFGTQRVTYKVREDDTWKGLVFKEPDKDYVRSWARDLQVDAVLAVTATISGNDGPVNAYVYDAIKNRWYEHSGHWATGQLVPTVTRIVRETIAEFKDRNP
jgi:Curli production assembly/transport component CsgG